MNFTSCKTKDHKEWTCIAWDDKNSTIQIYEYQNCHTNDGIGYCKQLAKRKCEKNEGYFLGGPFDSQRQFTCKINGQDTDFDTCELQQKSQVVKCCENHMNDEKTCINFASDDEFKQSLKVINNVINKESNDKKNNEAKDKKSN